MTSPIDFPVQLLPFRDKIEATRRPIVEMLATEARADPRSSRIGGKPWWPAERPWPLDDAGRPLFLLLQIDFAETPPLAPFPRAGLLQLFVANDTQRYLYGCNLDDLRKPTGFASVLHTDLSAPALTDFAFLENVEKFDLPLERPLEPIGLAFALSSMTMDSSDYRFARDFLEIYEDEALHECYFDWASEQRGAWRLGGYPTFTQADPRESASRCDPIDFTLATIDSAEGVMWGDLGAGQFLIDEKDLTAQDFSRVIYNWDCG